MSAWSGRHPAAAAAASTGAFEALVAGMPPPGQRRTVGGTAGSLPMALVAALSDGMANRLWVVVAPGPAEAEERFGDLEVLAPGAAVHYPQRELAAEDGGGESPEASGQRVEAVESVLAGRARILVATRRALQEVARIPGDLAGLRFTVAAGTPAGRDAVIGALEDRGFRRVPTVEEVGCYAVRGGIVDVFSLGAAGPARIEFSGDDVESVRLFDVRDQLSTHVVQSVDILPVAFDGGEARAPSAPDRLRTAARHDGDHRAVGEGPASLLDRLPGGAVLVRDGEADWAGEAEALWREASRRFQRAKRHGNPAVAPAELFLEPRRFAERAARFARLHTTETPAGDVVFSALPPPHVDRSTQVLRKFLATAAGAGASTTILCENQSQATRIEELVSDRQGAPSAGCTVVAGSISGGFRLPTASPPANVLTDHEIFRRRLRRPSTRRFRGAASVESLAQLSPGDHVVHMDHGIGRFRGLERFEIGGESLDALVIVYAGEELLRVPVHALDQVERWVAPDAEAEPPRLDRIGGRRWRNLKRRTEEAIQRMTAELLDLYALRKSKPGHAFSHDTRWQREMESAFPYEDTPDQRRAAEEVKRDMESPAIMDRLVCGDAGYGKTEVAVRAAFKAVQDGKQVAVLAPTTVLAAQHAGSFKERLDTYPVQVASLSRFEGTAKQREVLAGLRDGAVDVVVGTHRLLSGDIVFKDLGLLVVDEEQRLGVRQKERLKQLRTSVDVLTLSATPIPRTLHLSLAGIRDMSLIRTPPRDRLPIVTRVVPWHDRVVAEACEREIDRGGQVFFLHNRVETIETAAERVRALVASARVDVAHGQMRASRLHRTMTEFAGGRTDVLVCSAIIENGLDVSNANTLIVDRADRFGLSQLYQIRGRVGRSDRRAYCYLIAPERISEEAAGRLSVLEHYTELGSGYQIALRDLQARGAGNLLGDDQSGFAHAVGVETYLRLLNQAVQRIRNQPGRRDFPKPEVAMEQGAYLPSDYVADERQKLHVYRRLAGVSDRGDAARLAEEMADRFGPLPPEARRLVDQALLAQAGRDAGAARIHVHGRRARLDFRQDVAPRMSALADALGGEDVSVEVPRLAPLSVVLESGTEERLTGIAVGALDALGGTGGSGAGKPSEQGRADGAQAGKPLVQPRNGGSRTRAPLVAVGAALLAGGCGGGPLAEAAGHRLDVEGAAALVAEHSTVPADTQVVRVVAELWVDYTLLATEMTSDPTLGGLDVGEAIEPGLRERMLERLREDALEVDTVVSEREMAERFAAELPGARATASQILLLFPTDATRLQQDSVLAAANALRARLAEGEDFARLAAAFSDDAGNARRGGSLGSFVRGEMLGPVDSAVFGMSPGEVGGPVRTRLGYHLLKLERIDIPELSEVADDFRALIRLERLAEVEAAFVQMLDSAAGLALASGAVEASRALARSRPSRLAPRAGERPLLTWSGGAYTASDFVFLARRSPDGFAEGVAGASDEELEAALLRLGREELLFAEARARGLSPSDAERDSLAAEAREAIRERARRIGLHDDPDPAAGPAPGAADSLQEAEAQPAMPAEPVEALQRESGSLPQPATPAERVEALVEAALVRVVSGQQPIVPLGNVSFLLRAGGAWSVHAHRVATTTRRVRALQPY